GAAGTLRSEAGARPARGSDDRQHHRVRIAGAARRPAADLAGAALDLRTEAHQARDRALLGDRCRVPEPARRVGRHRNLHRLRLSQSGARRRAQRGGAERRSEGGLMGGARLTLERVHAGDRLPELAVDVSATTVVLGALASRDWRPMHHDKDFAQNRNGTRDIFLNTPNQAAWFERYLTDWSGPTGRLGRMKFRMKDSVFPGDRMLFRGR